MQTTPATATQALTRSTLTLREGERFCIGAVVVFVQMIEEEIVALSISGDRPPTSYRCREQKQLECRSVGALMTVAEIGVRGRKRVRLVIDHAVNCAPRLESKSRRVKGEGFV